MATSASSSVTLPTPEQIKHAVQELKPQLIELLTALVSYDTTLGNEATSNISSFVASAFQKMHLTTERQPILLDEIKSLKGYSPVDWSYDGKENVIGIHRPSLPSPSGKTILFNGHIDVVPTGPADLWKITKPFTPFVSDDGKLYGRGSGDMKGGVVSMMIAMMALRFLGFAPASQVTLCCVLEEECTGNGTLSSLHRGFSADVVLIPEPFPYITIAQLGVMWIQVTVIGRPAHVLNTSSGVNAIEASFKMVEALKQIEVDFNKCPSPLPEVYRGMSHPVNINLGKIKGGEWASSVPTECCFDVRIGIPPGFSLVKTKEKIEEILKTTAEKYQVKHRIDYNGFQAEGCVIDPHSPGIVCLDKAHKSIHNNTPPAYKALTCTTDARHYNLYYNTVATCYGPLAGNIHGLDEWVDLQSVADVASVYACFIADWCGLESI